MEPQLALEAGTTMFCTRGTSMSSILAERAKSDVKLLGYLREATHRNLYNMANSLAMNGLTSDSKVIDVVTWYEGAIIGVISASAVIAAASLALLGYSTFKKEEE